jgi:hypothetical protein
VYPNPAKDVATVLLLDEGKAHKLHFFNSFGCEVKHVILKPGQNKVDVNALLRGIYNVNASWNAGIIKGHFHVVR